MYLHVHLYQSVKKKKTQNFYKKTTKTGESDFICVALTRIE